MAKSQKQKTIIRHSEGAQRLWESSLLFLKIKVGDCHEPKGSRNDDYIKKLMANGQKLMAKKKHDETTFHSNFNPSICVGLHTRQWWRQQRQQQ